MKKHNGMRLMKLVGGNNNMYSTSLPESQYRECQDMVHLMDYQEMRFRGLMKKAGMSQSTWLAACSTEKKI